jgi:hypothetical protein
MVMKFTLLLLIAKISSIIIETDGRKSRYCVSKNFERSDTIEISYVVSGDQDEKISASFYDSHSQLLFEKSKEADGEYKGEAKETGVYKLCFFVLTDHKFDISFEFVSHYELGHSLNMAKDENIHEMKSYIGDINILFEEIERNTRYLTDRRSKHTEIINGILASVRNLTFLKLFVIIGVSVLQVFLIQKFFGNVGSKVSSQRYAHNVYGDTLNY